jgi:Reverse transcriptase (RNA-dependent DNA polymerase)
VVKPTIIHLILSLVVSKNWNIRQLDVNNAFLYGDLSEIIYMSQPPGFLDAEAPTHVCWLNKVIYGLCQSPRAWYHKLRETLLEIGFHTSSSDPSLFIFRHGNNLAFLLVYVDDIILTDTNTALLQTFVDLLDQRFTIKDLGRLHFFLDIEVNFKD